MTATITTAPAKPAKPRHPCGFCSTGHHTLCPGTVANGSAAPQKTWTCPCSETSHTLGAAHRETNVTRLPASARPEPRPVVTVTAPAAGSLPEPSMTRRQSRRPAKAAAFPDGVCSPYQFRAALIGAGLVGQDFKPQTVYTWVTKAEKGSGDFPVRYYATDGTVSDDPGSGRPGVVIADGLAWYSAQQLVAG